MTTDPGIGNLSAMNLSRDRPQAEIDLAERILSWGGGSKK
jgi:hypothetical protein